MKKKILIIVLAIYSAACYGQDKNKHSIEVNANYLSPINKNASSNLNYGFSLLLSEKIARIKVSIGVEYSDMNYNYTEQTNSVLTYLYKEEYKTKYINFPFLVYLIKNSERRLKIDPYAGIILTTVLDYDVIQQDPNSPPVSVKDSDTNYDSGLALRVGVNVSRQISKHIILNASPFYNVTLRENFNINDKYASNVPVNNSTFGIKLGIEYGW